MHKLLIVEDDEALRHVISRSFCDDYEVYEAENGREGLQKVNALHPKVIISDQRMPGMPGVELLSHAKSVLPYSVRILVTGYDDYGSVVDAVNAAKVHHYFEKPFHPHHIRSVVDAQVRSSELELQRDELLAKLQQSVGDLEKANAQLKRQEDRLRQQVEESTCELRRRNNELMEVNLKLKNLAVRDGLTGLFNHRYLVEHIEMEVARSKRYGRRFSLLFLDLDDFKQVNDRYGHQVGDQVLRQVAKLFFPAQPQGLRHSDFCARYGGEEFCVLLPETSLEGGKTKAERLRESVEAFDWRSVDGRFERSLTVCVGVAGFPEHGDDSQQILRQADEALYQAKKGGKNQVRVAGSG